MTDIGPSSPYGLSVFISVVLTDLLAADITHFEPWNYSDFAFVCVYETDSDWNRLYYVILRLGEFKKYIICVILIFL